MCSKVGLTRKSGFGCGLQSADGCGEKTTTSTITKAPPRPECRDTVATRAGASLRRVYKKSHENNLDELPGAGYTRSRLKSTGGDDRRLRIQSENILDEGTAMRLLRSGIDAVVPLVGAGF